MNFSESYLIDCNPEEIGSSISKTLDWVKQNGVADLKTPPTAKRTFCSSDYKKSAYNI